MASPYLLPLPPTPALFTNSSTSLHTKFDDTTTLYSHESETIFHSEAATSEFFTASSKEEGDKSTPPELLWFGPWRYMLARFCFIPLSLLCGTALILSLVLLPLTAGNTRLQSIALVSFIFYIFITFFVTLHASTISHDPLLHHQLRVFTLSWPLLILLHLCTFIPHLLTTHPLASCPALPACEAVLGSVCPPPQMEVYNNLLICQTNKGIFWTSLAALSLEVLALAVVGVTRILPALQNPKRKLWRKSIYDSPNLRWRFVPLIRLPPLPLPASPALPKLPRLKVHVRWAGPAAQLGVSSELGAGEVEGRTGMDLPRAGNEGEREGRVELWELPLQESLQRRTDLHLSTQPRTAHPSQTTNSEQTEVPRPGQARLPPKRERKTKEQIRREQREDEAKRVFGELSAIV